MRPDAVTDQTSAHDPVNGYLPIGWSLADWETKRAHRSRAASRAPARASMARHVEAMLEFHRQGIPTFDYGNNIRQMALEEGVKDAFAFPGFVPAYIRPLFCRGIGPFRWAALSGDPEDIRRTDAKVSELIPGDKHLHRWLDMAGERIEFQGLPARICWVGLGERHRLGLAFNEMVARGELKAPIVIGRDHLDSGSVASPNRETEAMRDGSDAVSDWPLLNALLNTASGATWVSIHHGGGVGMGFSQHAGVVIVCDGTPAAAQAHRPRAVERPGDRRHAPRRRGLRGGGRMRPRAGPRPADAAAVIHAHAGSSPLVLSMPHVGRGIPAGTRGADDGACARGAGHRLARRAAVRVRARAGAAWLEPRMSRYVVDLNRPPDDAALYAGQVSTGLCPRETFDGEPLYRDAGPTAAEIAARRDEYWQPYHAALAALLDAARARHGYAVLLDAHSIRSEVPRLFPGRLPDINLGTNDGRSCDPALAQAVVAVVGAQPVFSHVLDGRFKGGYITRHYGSPADGVHALQIELAQSAYMDERAAAYDAARAAPLVRLLGEVVDALLAFRPRWRAATAGRGSEGEP